MIHQTPFKIIIKHNAIVNSQTLMSQLNKYTRCRFNIYALIMYMHVGFMHLRVAPFTVNAAPNELLSFTCMHASMHIAVSLGLL